MHYQTELFKYINIARQSPAYYIQLIDKQLDSFINDNQMPIGSDIIYQTNEGMDAWKQARHFLQHQKPLVPFQFHQGLFHSSMHHANDLGRNGIFGHVGSDQSTFTERILRYCKKGHGAMAEIIGADFLIEGRNNAELTILALIIDDGVTERGHRRTIFNPNYRYIGCQSSVQNDKLISVFNFTENKLQLRHKESSHSEKDKSNLQLSSGVRQAKLGIRQTNNHKLDSQLSKNELKSKSNVTSTNLLVNFQRSAFNEISKNTIPRQSLTSNKSEFCKSEIKGKQIKEKKENTTTYFEGNCKVTQKTIQVFYSDGTTEENIEKHTVYS